MAQAASTSKDASPSSSSLLGGRVLTREAWSLGGLVVLAIALRVELLSTSLWLDEGYSLSSSHDLQGFDAMRPLYFLLLAAWSKLGTSSELWLRIPSVVFGVASVALCYVLARRLAGSATAFAAALMMCLATPQAYHSQEVRMYTLAPCALLGSLYALLLWLERPRWAALLAHGVAGYLAVLTFPPTILGIAVAWLLCLWSRRRERTQALCLGAVAALLLLAWSPFAYGLLKHPEGTTWLARPALSQLSTLQGWAFLSIGLWSAPLPWQLTMWTLRLFSGLVLLLALLGAQAPRLRGVGLWYFSIVLGLFAVSVLFKPVWTYHYFMPFLPALFLLVAGGLERLTSASRAAGYGLLSVVLALELLATGAQVHGAPVEDWRAAAQEATRAVNASDLVVVSALPLPGDPSNTGVWSYYYAGRAPVLYWKSEQDSPEDWLQKLLELRAQRASPGSKLWLALRTTRIGPSELAVLRARLAAHFAVDDKSYHNVTLFGLAGA